MCICGVRQQKPGTRCAMWLWLFQTSLCIESVCELCACCGYVCKEILLFCLSSEFDIPSAKSMLLSAYLTAYDLNINQENIHLFGLAFHPTTPIQENGRSIATFHSVNKTVAYTVCSMPWCQNHSVLSAHRLTVIQTTAVSRIRYRQ